MYQDGFFLFKQSKWHKDYGPDELEAYLKYPCLHNSIRIYYSKEIPVGLVTWAWFTPEDSEKFLRFERLPELSDYERREGTELWGIEFIAPYGHARSIFRKIREEHRQLYEAENVKWRRASDPLRVHKKRFN
jgi:cytolysin-activating lysine-acyltransferase